MLQLQGNRTHAQGKGAAPEDDRELQKMSVLPQSSLTHSHQARGEFREHVWRFQQPALYVTSLPPSRLKIFTAVVE